MRGVGGSAAGNGAESRPVNPTPTLGGHTTYGNSFLITLSGEVIRQDVEASMS